MIKKVMNMSRVFLFVTLSVIFMAVPAMAVDTETGSANRSNSPRGPFGVVDSIKNTGGILYMTSADCGSTAFRKYDPLTDTWTELSPYATNAQMAVSATGELYALNCETGSIDQYQASSDTWTIANPGPGVSLNSHGNLMIANNGQFLYTQVNDPNLYYTQGGTWTSMALPFAPNMMGDYDPSTGQCVLGEYRTTNAYLIDVFNSWEITEYPSSNYNGEWARFSTILDGKYYFEAGGSNIFSFDLSSPAAPVDEGVSPGWYNSSTPDRANHIIYTATLNGQDLFVFDPATGLLEQKASPNTTIGNHSVLAFVSEGGGGGDCQLDIDLAYHNGLEITVTVETPERAFLNVWVAYMNKIIPVMRGVRLPPGNDPREIPIVLNGFPQVGNIAVLGTLVSTDRSKGILCSDLEGVDTGARAAELLDEYDIDRVMQKFKDMIQ